MSLPRTVPKAHDFVQGIEKAVKRARRELQAAQNRMVMRENARRRDVSYEPGELVLLSTKNLNQPGPGVRKLKPSYLGPFEVQGMVGKVAVKLRLPLAWSRVHNVFHVNLVKPYKPRSENQPSRQCTQPPPPVQFYNGEPLWEVESLLDREVVGKGKRRSYRFFVKWTGYDDENNMWEPEKKLVTCEELLREYKASRGLPW